MPMGVTEASIKSMPIDSLRQLGDIARQMAAQTTFSAFAPEYTELADLIAAELRRRELMAAVAQAIRERVGMHRTRAQDAARLNKAKNLLAKKGIDIAVAPDKISDARLYHLGVVAEATEAIASKNKYLTERPSRSVKKSQLPSKPLLEQYDAAKEAEEASLDAFQEIVNGKIEETKETDRLRRAVTIPARLQVSGPLVDRGTYLYPAGGSLLYSTSKKYLLHPARALIHVIHKLPQYASPELASAYLAQLVAGCVGFLELGKLDGQEHQVKGFTLSGKPFHWNIIGKLNASDQGYAGEIYHIDSGYKKSPWRFEK